MRIVPSAVWTVPLPSSLTPTSLWPCMSSRRRSLARRSRAPRALWKTYSNLLCQQGILHQPLLYLSHYLKAHRAEYYDRLTAIRTEGNWEGWLKFFLRGVFEVSQAATTTARAILDLREAHRQAITQKAGGSANGLILLDYLFEQPMTMVRLVERQLHCAYATAGKLVDQLVDLGLLRETTGGQRNRVFRYEPYLALFEPPILLEAAGAPERPAIETTGAGELPASR